MLTKEDMEEIEKINLLLQLGKISVNDAKKMKREILERESYSHKRLGRVIGGAVEPMSIRDPKLRSALNQGRNELRAFAKDFYEKKLSELKARLTSAKTEAEHAKTALETAWKEADDFVKAKSGDKDSLSDVAGLAAAAPIPHAKAVGIAASLLGSIGQQGKGDKGAIILKEKLNERFQTYQEKEQELTKLLKWDDLDNKRYAANIMKEAFREKAENIAARIISDLEYR